MKVKDKGQDKDTSQGESARLFYHNIVAIIDILLPKI